MGSATTAILSLPHLERRSQSHEIRRTTPIRLRIRANRSVSRTVTTRSNLRGGPLAKVPTAAKATPFKTWTTASWRTMNSRTRGHTSNGTSRMPPSPSLIKGQMLSSAKWRVNFKALAARKVHPYRRASQSWRRAKITRSEKMLLTKIMINHSKICSTPGLTKQHESTGPLPSWSKSLWTNSKDNSSRPPPIFCCRSTKYPPSPENRVMNLATTFVFPAN